MIVSWNWLQDYVRLDMPPAALTDRLTMSGFNLEGVADVGGDKSIDLEITSNRPDCLGHIGVAREISVLFDTPLSIPEAWPPVNAEKTKTATSVTIECDDLCPRYIARIIRGVKVGPSPEWLRQRLETLGIASINNVVDVTNYVLMECGQPLHAFDLDKLHGRRIIVRRARPGEKLVAIDHNEYPLAGEMCIIADADHPVAIGGVMGGAETEIGPRTVNLLIETADFTPPSIRNTAQARPAQRFIVSIRTRHRRCRYGLGQPTVLPVDSANGRRRIARRTGGRGAGPREPAHVHYAALPSDLAIARYRSACQAHDANSGIPGNQTRRSG